MATSDKRRRLLEPLDSVTTFFGVLTILGTLVVAAFFVFGSGHYFSSPTDVCVVQPAAEYSSGGWSTPLAAARPGNSIAMSGSLQVCADHATVGEQALGVTAALPEVLFWGGVLFLLWRLMVTARRDGPFTPRVAAALRRLGWFIIIGSTAAAVVHLVAIDALLTIMVKLPQSPFTNLLLVPVHMPIPVLTGAALLTFARIVRAGAAMDAEIQGTI
jgi:hypothetical protein